MSVTQKSIVRFLFFVLKTTNNRKKPTTTEKNQQQQKQNKLFCPTGICYEGEGSVAVLYTIQ